MTPIRRVLLAVLLGLTLITRPDGVMAKTGVAFQMALGNPSGATTNSLVRTNFLIARSQYALSYNDDTHQANWVSWSYSTTDSGSTGRTDAWATETALPSGYLRIGTAAFDSGYDRGHMCPSGDRTASVTDNELTFRMSNIIPQASQNNQGLWAQFEQYCRNMAADGDEVLIICGGSGFTGARISNQMAIPGSVWKVAVEVPNASSTVPADSRVTTSARVIAILTPNVSTGLGTWQSYITSVEHIEEVTGLNFFTEVDDPSVAIYLKNLVDTGSGPNTPTVLTTFNPTFGPPGTVVTISGYNFGTSPVVTFNGVPATSSVSGNQILATVPAGAATGAITVTGTGGTDTSYEDFTVTAGTTPTLSLSRASITGLTAIEGAAGTAQVCTVSGTSLAGAVTVGAPTSFEVSLDNQNFGNSLVLTPTAGGLAAVPVYVRIAAGASTGLVEGTVTCSGGGATTQSLPVSGTVLSSAPFVSLSTSSLSGFSATPGMVGESKSYAVSGGNLAGTLTITAPAGYEVSLDNVSFSASLAVTPQSGTLTNVPVFVRLTSSAPMGAVNGSLLHSTAGATDQSLAVFGTVASGGGGGGSAVTLARWTFETSAPSATGTTCGPLAAEEGVQAAAALGVHTSASTAFSSPSGNGSARAFSANNWTTNDYYQFQVSSTGMQELQLTFDHTGSNTGPAEFKVTYSTNGTNFTDFAIYNIPRPNNTTISWSSTTSNSNSTLSFNLAGLTALNNQPAIFLRLQPRSAVSMTNGTVASTGTSRIDNVTVSAKTATTSLAPVISSATTASATALVSFSYQILASNDPTAFSASGLPDGLSLDPATGLISGLPSAPGVYLVALRASNSDGDGTATLQITVAPNPSAPVISGPLTQVGQVGMAFELQLLASNTPLLYVASGLPPGLTIDTATGLISGAPQTNGTYPVAVTAQNNFGSDTKVVTLTILAPTLGITPASLNSFNANFGFSGLAQTYTLTGQELAGPVTVLAPSGFEISANGSPYGAEFSISPDNARNLAVTVSVRLSAAATLGPQSGTLIHSASGAVPKYIAIEGSVVASSPTIGLSPTFLPSFTTKAGTASFTQSYTLTGSSLTGPVTIAAPAGFEISSGGSAFSPSISVIPANGDIGPIGIEVRLAAATPVGNYAGDITHSGGGAGTVSVAVAGNVTQPSGPPITSTLSGSIYAGGSFSYTITAGGTVPVTGFGASGLPQGLVVNTTTGVISGTPSATGIVTFNISASTAEGTTTATYTLRVVTAAEQGALPLSVVVNKFRNAAVDQVELLVTGDNVDGPPVDMRGMVLKDFTSNTAGDRGGKFVFANHPLWASVRAGTLIVLSASNAQAEDLDASDFLLRANLGNPSLFTTAAGGFDLLNTDMVMVKAAGMGVDGVAGGIHALAVGNSGAQYSSFTGRKIRSFSALTNSRSFVYVLNDTPSLPDFYASGEADIARSLTFGTGSNTSNTTFINTLRNLDQAPPVITLNGASVMQLAVGQGFTDPGASAFDTVDGIVSVSLSGSVNTATSGTYILTYSARDAAGNLSIPGERTVIVTAPPTALETWASSFGLTGTDALGTSDPDRDGWDNFKEFAFGQNPSSPSARLTDVEVLAGNTLRVRYLTRPGLTYTVRKGTDLASGFPETLTATLSADQGNVPDGCSRYEAALPVSGAATFIKVEAVQLD